MTFKSLVLFVVIVLRLSNIGFASDSHEYDEHSELEELAGLFSDIDISDSFSEIWQRIKQLEDKLFIVIREKNLDKIHEHSLVIQKLLRILNEKTNEGLNLKQNSRISDSIEKVIEQVRILHKFGHSERLRSAQSNWFTLKRYLKDLENLYSKDMLTEKKSEMGYDHHEGHGNHKH